MVLFRILLILSLFIIVLSTNEHYGIDDWKQENIEKFIESNTGLDIDPNALTSLGLYDGGDFVEKINSESVDMLIKDPKKREKLLSSYETLLVHKRHNPVDVFEWRILNRKLCDFWIVPLLISQPRVLLLWARYFDKDPVIEKINNEIDEIPAWQFWMYNIFCPQVLIAQIATKFNSTAAIDDYIKYFLLLSAIAEVCILIRFLYLLYLFCVVISDYMGSSAFFGVLLAPFIVLYVIFNSKPLLEEVKKEFPHFELLFFKVPIVFGFYTFIGILYALPLLLIPPLVEDYVAYFFFFVGGPISLILSSVAINKQFDDVIRVNRLKEKILEAMPNFISTLKTKSD